MKVSVFSSAYDYMSWDSRNCAQCSEEGRCELESALSSSYGNGFFIDITLIEEYTGEVAAIAKDCNKRRQK